MDQEINHIDSVKKDPARFVNARVDQEQAEGEPENIKPHGERWFTNKQAIAYIQHSERGLGEAVKFILDKAFLFEVRSERWYRRDGHLWRPCLRGEIVDGVGMLREELEAARDSFFSEAAALREAADSKGAEHKEKQAEFVQKRGIDPLNRLSVIKKIIELARCGENSLARDGEWFDSHPYMLAVINGYIDLRTGELNTRAGKNVFTKYCPVEWRGLYEPCPLFERFLQEIFLNDEALILYAQIIFGAALIGLSIEHMLVLLFGFGRNGKGTLVELLKYILGSYARAIPSEMLIDRGMPRNPAAPSPDIMSLKGARFAFAAETDKGRRFSVALIKWLTGGDTLTGRGGFDRCTTDFIPSHNLFVQTNHLPSVPADDLGFWSRVHVIPFHARFVDGEPQANNEFRMNKDLLQQLKTEAPGVFAWLVRGCLRFQDDKELKKPDAVLNANKEYCESVDRLAEFFGCCTYLAPDRGLTVTALFKEYSAWAELAGVRPVGRDSFIDSVKRKQKLSHETHSDGHGRLYSCLAVYPQSEWQT